MAPISRFVIMVSEAPYASLKPYTALRYAASARKRGLETKVIFFADGVFCVKRGVGRDSRTVGDFEAKVRGLMEDGIQVQACRAPMRLYALTEEDLIEGVTVAEDVIGHALDEQTKVIWL
jgi:sulfur relay (sulfurtransferase) complex TusBCD TusD component (DsrE family)